jgi:hypothetical protein
MLKSIRHIKKQRGRPKATERGETVTLRLHEPLMASLDLWRARQNDTPSRPEAIRRLIDMSLARPPQADNFVESSKLASRQIDRMGDQTATSEERASRKRRLIKGPKEFRDIRGGRSKR